MHRNGKARFVYEKPQYGGGGRYVVQSADTLFAANMHTHKHNEVTSKMCETATVHLSDHLQGSYHLVGAVTPANTEQTHQIFSILF